METPLDVLSRAASLVHADDEKREAALRGEPRLQTLPVASALTSHRTGPPPISPSKRKFTVEHGDDELDCESDHASKMSRIFAPHLNKTANGDCRKDPRERSRSPIERAVAPAVSLHGSHLYTSLPSLSMEQPLALTKNSLDAGRPAGLSPTLTPVERQQAKLTALMRTPALTRAQGRSGGFVALPPRWLLEGADFSLAYLLCVGPTPPCPHSTPWGSWPGESREPDYQTPVTTTRKNCSWREPSPRSLARPKPRSAWRTGDVQSVHSPGAAHDAVSKPCSCGNSKRNTAATCSASQPPCHQGTDTPFPV